MVAIKRAALLAGLAQLIGTSAAQDAITDDSHFYGQSPPVYPSPEMVGGNEWEAAFQKAKLLVGQMTLEEKVNLTAGVTKDSTCSGNIPAIERLRFPGMCLSDAGNGLRNTDFVSGFPSGIHVGASWSKDLAFRRGTTMGGEFKTKGVNVLLGPVVGPAWRIVRGGRNWEGFSVDPWLSGQLVAQTVSGIQGQGVITSTKVSILRATLSILIPNVLQHYIGNEQETNRNPEGNISSVSSNIDDKTIHEVYLWPFQDAVRAGSGNIMCSYQRVNNSYGCSNSKTLNGLLKSELGFQGFVVSDWGAQHAGVATAKAGLDVAMPSNGGFWGDHLIEAVKNGSLPESRVTDMAMRVIASWYQFNQDQDFPKPGIGMPSNVLDPHEIVDGRDPAAAPVLLNGAIEGHVLVKNTKDTLPLKSPRMLSLFGYSAKTPDDFNPSANSLFMAAFGENGTMFGGGGSGAITPALAISPFEALKMRAYQDGTAVFNDFISDRPSVEPSSDACIVFGNAWASEGSDRPAIRDDYSDSLIKSVADQCNKTVVIFHNAGPRLVEGFIDHPNVTAVIFAHLPGQESGPALVSLLFGDTSPSGKLPYTVAKNESDYGDVLDPAQPKGEFANFPQADFNEGIYLDYRYFDKKGIEPRYEFGFGLSYTTFAYSNISINYIEGANTYPWPGGPIVSGGQTDLWDAIATVSVNVKNTGSVAGAEVAQLYVGIPGAPTKQQLRGFEKPFLQPSQSETVTFHLTRRDLSVWSVERQKWQLQQGTYKFYVGSSSRRLPLNGTMHL
ncbi:glycoside hydrolase family 3 protein [Trichoderma atroviride IMI 206040]|uniref:beta-glucosidase n=1 Tax=Hypocrea atroviridis (strain ATCC 20476 / IMI 206040) TaxID=452589 RepID=G9P6W2_HYPAI|nr:glycoside hydrolase family 3 protein [Trichoderma atroviride IMI 206040]EHK40687.1 glycoside hydrolase family 3 protein [Trichoderma atroviride IMI 206040]